MNGSSIPFKPQIDSARIKLSVQRERETSEMASESNEIISYKVDFLEPEESLETLKETVIELEVVFSDVIKAENEIYATMSKEYGDVLESDELTKEKNLPRIVATLVTGYTLNKEEKRYLFVRITNTYLGKGILQPLWNDPVITEIILNPKFNNIKVEIGGQLYSIGEGQELYPHIKFPSERAYIEYVRKLFSQTGRSVDKKNCKQNGDLPDGSRLTVNWMPIVRYPTLNIRKPPQSTIRYTSEKYIETGAANQEIMEHLGYMTRGYRNIFILGATGTSKTTVVRIAIEEHARKDRVVYLEDTRELNPDHPDFTSLTTVERAVEPVTYKELFRQVLRMRPDRIGIQELRGGEETTSVLKSAMAGHSGIITTAFAEGPDEFVDLLIIWLQEAGMNISELHLRKMVHRVLDILVFVQRLETGERKIVNYYEVLPYEPDKECFKLLYKYDRRSKTHVQCGKLSQRTVERCFNKGVEIPDKFVEGMDVAI